MKVIVMEETRALVGERLREFLSKETGIAGIHDQTRLLAAGVLDSLLVLSVISYCEKEFDCVFEPDELEERHFETIGVLAEQVCRKLRLQSGG